MQEHKFENIGWTVGNHCNATCGHCYSWKVRKDSREFLTKSDVDRVVGQLKRLGVKTVNLGGNEPIYTHGPDLKSTILPYIIRALTENGLPVGLTTNGATFIYLEKRYPTELLMINDIDFSLDSPFEAEHNLPKACRESGCDYLETCRGGCSSRSYLVHGDLESKDPYCPQEYTTRHGTPHFPYKPEIGCHEGFRVHENYLCAWIGKVNPELGNEQYK